MQYDELQKGKQQLDMSYEEASKQLQHEVDAFMKTRQDYQRQVEQVVERVQQATREYPGNKQIFYHAVERSNAEMHQMSLQYEAKLSVKRQEISRYYHRKLDALDEQYKAAKRASELK